MPADSDAWNEVVSTTQATYLPSQFVRWLWGLTAMVVIALGPVLLLLNGWGWAQQKVQDTRESIASKRAVRARRKRISRAYARLKSQLIGLRK